MHGGQRATEARRGGARAHAHAAEAERVRVERGGADDRREHSLARTRRLRSRACSARRCACDELQRTVWARNRTDETRQRLDRFGATAAQRCRGAKTHTNKQTGAAEAFASP